MKGSKTNAEWHRANRMPKNPTEEQRVQWHAAHAEACGCRAVPPALAAKIRALKRKSPGRAN
jgi:hypothetical protein